MTGAGRQALAPAIEMLRDRIGYMRQGRSSIGEQNTKSALINPLLSAVGWDVENVDEVCLEYKRDPQDNPVDYALFMGGKPCLFVEAKALDADLGDHRWVIQTLGYAVAAGVEWCVLTNGDEYRLYNSHATVAADEKLFRSVRISNSYEHRYTAATLELLSKENLTERRLNALWRTHLVDRGVKGALQRLVWNQDASLVRLLRKRTVDLAPRDIRDSLDRAHLKLEFSDIGLGALRADAPTPGARATPAAARKRRVAALRAQRTRNMRQAARAADRAERARYLGKASAYEARIRELIGTAARGQPQESTPEPGTARDRIGRDWTIKRTAGRKKHQVPHWLSLAHLIEAALIEAPLDLEATFKGRRLEATVRPDGTVIFAGKVYTSLSVAADIARNAVTGPPSGGRLYWHTNGWTFWKYRDDETGRLEVVHSLRQRYLQRRG